MRPTLEEALAAVAGSDEYRWSGRRHGEFEGDFAPGAPPITGTVAEAWMPMSEGNKLCEKAIGRRMERLRRSLGAFSTRWRDRRASD